MELELIGYPPATCLMVPDDTAFLLFWHYDNGNIMETEFFQAKNKHSRFLESAYITWLRRLDLNQRPSGYEPDELPSCSTPRYTI